MATKKKATKKKAAKKSAKKKAGKKASGSALSQLLKFKIDWIKDPVPIFRQFLDRDALKQLDAAKREFANRVDQILKGR